MIRIVPFCHSTKISHNHKSTHPYNYPTRPILLHQPTITSPAARSSANRQPFHINTLIHLLWRKNPFKWLIPSNLFPLHQTSLSQKKKGHNLHIYPPWPPFPSLTWMIMSLPHYFRKYHKLVKSTGSFKSSIMESLKNYVKKWWLLLPSSSNCLLKKELSFSLKIIPNK